MAAIPAAAIGPEGIQYYIAATDGDNGSVFPVDAPVQTRSVVQERSVQPMVLNQPKLATGKQAIQWQPVPGANYY